MALSQDFMNLCQTASWIVAAVGGVTAAFTAVVQMGKNRRQSQKELRWRQAREAKDFLHELKTDPLTRDAMWMLDWDGREYEIRKNTFRRISTVSMLKALRTKNLKFTESERYVRDCFDQFFNSMGVLNDFVEARLIRFHDIKSFVGYYVKVMRRNNEVFEGFMRKYDYPSAIRLFGHFPQ